MHIGKHPLLLVGLFMLVLLTAIRPAAADVGPLDSEAIDRYVEAEMAAAHIPGMALGIVKDGQVLYLKGYGVADPSGRTVTPQTPFMLGSVSKSFTALAIMQCVEAGQIDLDAAVQTYLPWLQLADHEAAAHITIRQLLNHTSGISRYAGEVQLITPAGDTIAGSIRALSGMELVSSPGERHEYSNLNYVILGGVIEAVAGGSYGDYVQEHIFQPLEMRNSYTSESAAQPAGLATGYQSFFGFTKPTHPSFPPANVPAGFIIASAEDMCNYLAMWQNEGRFGQATLVSPEGALTLQTPSTAASPRTRYALGWYSNPEGSVVWHGGSTLNFRSSVKMLRSQRLAVVALYNNTDSLWQAVYGQGILIQDGVISILYGEAPPRHNWINTGRIAYLWDGIAVVLLALLGLQALGLRHGRIRPIATWRAAATIIGGAVALVLLLLLVRSLSLVVLLANVPDYGTVALLLLVGQMILAIVQVGLGIRSARTARLLTAQGARSE